MGILTPTAPTEQVENVSVAAMLQRLAQQLDSLNEKKKSVVEQIDAMLCEHEDYNDAYEAAAEAAKSKKQIRERIITENNDLQVMVSNLDDLKDDIKMVQESLNDYLMLHYKQTGETEFDDGSGNKRKIKIKMSVAPGQLRMF